MWSFVLLYVKIRSGVLQIGYIKIVQRLQDNPFLFPAGNNRRLPPDRTGRIPAVQHKIPDAKLRREHVHRENKCVAPTGHTGKSMAADGSDDENAAACDNPCPRLDIAQNEKISFNFKALPVS